MTDLDQRAEIDSRAPEQANEMLRLVGRRASAEIQRTSSRPAEIASRAPGKAAEHERRDTKTTETKTEQQVHPSTLETSQLALETSLQLAEVLERVGPQQS